MTGWWGGGKREKSGRVSLLLLRFPGSSAEDAASLEPPLAAHSLLGCVSL